MAEHRETFAEDVGGKLLLLASMLAVFGVIALVLMPLGTALAPQPPTEMATVQAEGTSAPAEATAPAAEAPPAPAGDATAAAPAGPPSVAGAIMPGLFMLIGAAVLAALAGLFLGYAKARAEEPHTADPTTPH